MQITQALDREQLDTARMLFLEYTRSVDGPACFGGFAEELARLPGDYAPPEGRLLLAFVDGHAAGCLGLRRLSHEAAELKRLYVRPAYQGRKVARQLLQAAIEAAQANGYLRLLLDTLPQMQAARALYVERGFCPVPPYLAEPTPGALCFELTLPMIAASPIASASRAPDALE